LETAGLAGLLVRGVQNFVRDAQAFDGQVVHDVRLDDFVDVRGLNAAVEYALGIDRDSRSELALVEAAGLVGATQFDAPLVVLNLEQALQFAATGRIAAAARVAGFALVHANEDVLGEFRHGGKIIALDGLWGNQGLWGGPTAPAGGGTRETRGRGCGRRAPPPPTHSCP